MSNIEKAAEWLYIHSDDEADYFIKVGRTFGELPSYEVERWRKKAQALAGAGLLAPELTPSSLNRHHGWWAAKGVADVSIAPEERVILELKEDDALFTPAEARELAHALLAAANYAEEANQ